MSKEMNGPEIPKFMGGNPDELFQDRSKEDLDLGKLNLESVGLVHDKAKDRAIAREKMRARRERERQLRILKRKLITFGIPVVTATALISVGMVILIKEGSEYLKCRKGASSIYEQMIESKNLPSKFKIRYLDYPANEYDLVYENEVGEKIKRENINIKDYVHDTLIDALDNGYSKAEVASALGYAGLGDRTAKYLLDVTDEELVACELDHYQLLQEQEEVQTEYVEARRGK